MAPIHPEIDLRHLLEQMQLIRAYEEAIVAGSAAGKVPGTCTSVGQKPPPSASSMPSRPTT